MYYDFLVKVPEQTLGITQKNIKGTTYIYYSYNHKYSSEKKYTVPRATTIGKQISDDSDMMYPNANFLKYFPSADLPDEKTPGNKSACLRIGTYLVLRKIIADYGLEDILNSIIGKDSGLFLDIAAYTIVKEWI